MEKNQPRIPPGTRRVIVVDSNLPTYAHREDSEFHTASKEMVDAMRHQFASWAIPWPCAHKFIGI